MIKTSDLIQAVRHAAATNPYEVIPPGQCAYKAEGRPSCIIGNALFQCGASLNDLSRYDVGRPADVVSSIDVVIDFYPDDFQVDSVEDILWLRHVQMEQDHQVCWGDAVKMVDNLDGDYVYASEIVLPELK